MQLQCLAKLVEADVLARAQLTGRGNPVAYTLTEAGRDLLPVIVALMQWPKPPSLTKQRDLHPVPVFRTEKLAS